MVNDAAVILGAGGHARSLIELLDSQSRQIIGVYDDSYRPGVHEMIGRCPLLGDLSMLPDNACLVLAVGDNRRRADLFRHYRQQVLAASLLHRTAYSASSVCIGKANQLFANVFINAQARIGDNNIINSGAIIEHETRVGSHNHISVGAILCGRVAIGDHCMIGAGSVVIDKISICDHVTVGANSTVIRSIDEPGVYVGSPARRVK